MHGECKIAAPVTGVQALMSVAGRTIYSVVINFIKVNFVRRVMNVMLVRWEARPISAWSIDLDKHQLVGWKIGRHYVHDLPRCIAAASQADLHILWADQ